MKNEMRNAFFDRMWSKFEAISNEDNYKNLFKQTEWNILSVKMCD